MSGIEPAKFWSKVELGTSQIFRPWSKETEFKSRGGKAFCWVDI